MQLTTSRLVLDPLRPADANEMVEVLADPSLYTFIGGTPPTLEELTERYRRMAAGRSADGSQEWRNWVARLRDGGVAIGTVQATIDRGSGDAEIAWVIGRRWQGRGYASEAARALVRHLDADGAPRILAHVPDHAASEAVARHAGLAPTDAWVDGERVWLRAREGAGR